MRRPYLYIGDSANQEARAPPVGFSQGPEDNDYDGEDGEDSENDTVLTDARGDIFESCLVTTMRALGRGGLGIGSGITSWLWVVVSLVCKYLLIRALHTYAMMHGAFIGVTGNIVEWSEKLEGVIAQNKTLESSGTDLDIVKFCFEQPTPTTYMVVEFIWCGWIVGHMGNPRTMLTQILMCPSTTSVEETVQEEDERLTILALRRVDKIVLSLTLVLPRMLLVLLMWYVAIESLAVRWSLEQIILQVIVFQFICTLDTTIFQTFLSRSKKAWVERCQIVQTRGRLLRMGISWPGELLKLLVVCGVVVIGWYMFKTEGHMRELCNRCLYDCERPCSRAFAQCTFKDNDPFVPGFINKVFELLLKP